MTAAALLIGCNQPVQQAQPAANADDKLSVGNTGDELSPDVFPQESSTNTITLNGWKVSYPNSCKQLGMTMNDGVLKIQFEEFTFEVRDSVISVDNQEFGRASKGDTVLIGINGEIAVNGKARQPNGDD